MAKFTKVKKSSDRSREARKPCIAAKVEYGWKTQAHNLHFIVAKCMLNVCRKVSLTLYAAFKRWTDADGETA